MDGNRVVLDISSDEDVGFNWPATEGCDSDIDWSELFHNLQSDAGNKPNSDKGYESDDVVVIGEVKANPKRAKKSSGVDKLADQCREEDDDCVILEGDPDKPASEVKDSGCDSDDLVIVSEKGQVACRDYPHPRHLCVKFPFGSTLHSEYCKLCHCYVCDSPAPCGSWGNGSSGTDHCHATEKEELWKSERKRTKQGLAPVVSNADTAFWRDLLGQIPTNVLPVAQNPVSSGNLPGQAPSYDRPNIIRNQRTSSLPGRSRYYQQSQHPIYPCSNNLQRARVSNSNPHSVTPSPFLKRPRPLGMDGASVAALKNDLTHAIMIGVKRGFTNYRMGNPSAPKRINTGQLHMGQNSSAVNPSQGQAQLYGQSNARANGNPSVHLNVNLNQHISAPVPSNAPGSTSQQSQCLTGLLEPLPLTGEQSWNGANPDLPNWGELDNQVLNELPVLDAEDGIYADNLWQF